MKRGCLLSFCAAIVVGCTAAWAAEKEELVPLIQMENVPLTDAIRQIARQARLNVLLDPRLSAAPYNQMTVSIRWENVTSREALIALLDNYDLVLVESRNGSRRTHQP